MPYFATAPLPIVDVPANGSHKGGVRLGYRWIVLHATGGTDSTAWLSTTSNPPVSVQRLIKKDGTNQKIMQDNEVAWTQGPAQIGRLPRRHQYGAVIEDANQWALAIELENLNNGIDPYPIPQIGMTVDQCLEWWGQFGALPIVGHSWVQSNKTDPAGFPWHTFYALLFERLGRLL